MKRRDHILTLKRLELLPHLLNSEMFLEAIISSPLATIAAVEGLLATVINAVLLYIIYKCTPPKMKDYRLILLTMAVRY